jgi:hypothetical protein
LSDAGAPVIKVLLMIVFSETGSGQLSALPLKYFLLTAVCY